MIVSDNCLPPPPMHADTHTTDCSTTGPVCVLHNQIRPILTTLLYVLTKAI